MHKILMIICGITLISVLARAEDGSASSAVKDICEEKAGILIQGNDGTYYCQSRGKMNWWTALGWCQKLGLKLISYPQECNCEGSTCPVGTKNCLNLTGVGSGTVWTSAPNGNERAYWVQLSNGYISGSDPRNIATFQSALCK